MRLNKGRYSFTLIELLMVVVVIMILIALVMPVIWKAREKGQSAKCKTNLRQLQAAAMSYYYANGRFPYGRTTEYEDTNGWHYGVIGWIHWSPENANTPHGTKVVAQGGGSPYRNAYSFVTWWGQQAVTNMQKGALFDYTGESLRMYLCPSFNGAMTWANDPLWNKPIKETNGSMRSYGINSQVAGGGMGGIHASRRLLFADQSVVKTYNGQTIANRCMCEWVGWGGEDGSALGWDGELVGTPYPGQSYPYESVGVFHGGKGNAVFADGHVEELNWYDTTNACSGNW